MTSLEIPNVGTFTVDTWTAGEGSPVLFLHGYERHPGGASFLQRLSESHHVVAPEQPGYGTSTGFEHIEDIFDLVLFYRSYVESLGLGPVDVIGHSTGGMLAAELAAIAPQLVNKLVLVDAFGLWLDDDPSQDPFGEASAVKAAKWHDVDAIPKPEPTNFVPDPDDQYAAIMFSARNLATATKFMWPIADRGLRRRLPYISAPTLVVNGASDRLVPVSYAEEAVRLIPSAQLAVIDGAAHYPMFEQEDAFVAAVQNFLG
jgi:pimeloyl-ACP methyl ester carboxylesterase